MSLDFLSGLLLTGVALFIVGFLLKEIFGERAARFFSSGSRKPAKSVNEHLIGAVAKVVDNTKRDDGLIKVRVGIERWSAKLHSTDDRSLPVGAEVRITAVTGLVLEVEENNSG